MRVEFQHLLDSYPAAAREPFSDHPVARFVRGELAASVRAALESDQATLTIKASAGQSKWADIPWVAIMDPIVTDSPESGYYVTYLFNCGAGRLIASLQLGTTAVRQEFGLDEARRELERLVNLVRVRVPEHASTFTVAPIDLSASSSASRASFYEVAHAFGVTYETLPEEARLVADLKEMVRLSRLLTYRGGIDSPNEESNLADPEDYSAEEGGRKYRLHLRIERSRSLAKKAKAFHGYICQACGFNFAQVYGTLGERYIEAHHLKPLSQLSENVATRVDARSDFAVLCANCHRMIHRHGAPPGIREFQQLLGNNGE